MLRAYNPRMAELHPIIVHFTVALTVVGVLLRLVSLTGRVPFAGPAAALLIIVSAATSVAAVKSGADAHGPAERVPGARAAVVEHEEWGERARNGLLVVAALELVALALRRNPRVRLVHAASAAFGLMALFMVYEAGEHGGDLVYAYAGGVGIRSGDPRDVERLLIAGAYHQSQADRKAGRAEQAAALADMLAERFPSDVEVQLMAAESQLVDRKAPEAALRILTGAVPAPANRAAVSRRVSLLADAFEQLGRPSDAIAALEAAVAQLGGNARLQARIDKLRGAPSSPRQP